MSGLGVRRRITERRLSDVSTRLRRAQEDLVVLREQQVHLDADADEARVRSIVSDDRSAGGEHRGAQGSADAAARHAARLTQEIETLRGRQDRLLDQLAATIRDSR